MGRTLTENLQQVARSPAGVRAGYQVGEQLYCRCTDLRARVILHVIGERPGSGHHAFSVYVTVARGAVWARPGAVDHDITKVIAGIADTALAPTLAAAQTIAAVQQLAAPECLNSHEFRGVGANEVSDRFRNTP